MRRSSDSDKTRREVRNETSALSARLAARSRGLRVLFIVCGLALQAIGVVHAREPGAVPIEFGVDIGDAAGDDVCGDPRFRDRPGFLQSRMAERPTPESLFHDASDCRAAYEDGAILLRIDVDGIDFGEDGGARDYVCRDPRFEHLAAETGGAESRDERPEGEDATDCRMAYLAERVWLLERVSDGNHEHELVFGNNGGRWPQDEECDDGRFENKPGEQGMAESLVVENIRRDADDCRDAFMDGKVALRPSGPRDGIDFGNDRMWRWAFDFECDDGRFENRPGRQGMAESTQAEAVGHDATDCREAYDNGDIERTEVMDPDDFRFGDDTSAWSYDGECDDDRFVGEGTAATVAREHRGHDATDCFRAYRDGRIVLKEAD